MTSLPRTENPRSPRLTSKSESMARRKDVREMVPSCAGESSQNDGLSHGQPDTEVSDAKNRGRKRP